MADPDDSFQAADAIGTSTISVFSPSLSRVRSHTPQVHHSSLRPEMSALTPTERDPLLHGARKVKKPFYRARPLWLVPFAISASVIRGMTLGPRIEVFTQLSCNAVYGHDVYDHTTTNLSLVSAYHTPLHIDPVGPHLSRLDFGFSRFRKRSLATFQDTAGTGDEDDNDEPDPRQVPSKRCLQDATVQAGAARLQVIMTTTMGVLSALTTGWWGHFGELHGRTRVLAAATLGLFLTDLTFILVSTPHSIFAAHGHKLLVISPAIEGMLGGWQTLQAAINAYVSDCTSDGSRAQIFSRFTGVSFLGLSIGPTIGAFLITHPIFKSVPPPSSSAHAGTATVTSVFYVAAMCSFANLLLALFVFPEAPKKHAKIGQELRTVPDEDAPRKQGHLAGFLAPFALLAPQTVQRPNGTTAKDYRLTLIALTLLVYALSTGIFQIKYLYAEHIYGWGAEQLSYYISAMGLARTLYLLAVMPLIVLTFKPKREPVSHPTHAAVIPSKKAPPTAAQVAREMKFDFVLLRLSLVVDLLSHTLVTLSPENTSAAMFTAYTSLSSFGAGVDPAMQSLALCIMQANGEDNRGKLFGAFAMLRTVGQMIIGPILFGLIYSTTVAQFPKAIFIAAGAFAFAALVLICLVRPDAGLRAKVPSRRRDDSEIERGRSRVSKDISHSSMNPTRADSASGLR
ncbi:MFS general substrate transporter [Sparassis latifolia]